jgi:hypothetical protein
MNWNRFTLLTLVFILSTTIASADEGISTTFGVHKEGLSTVKLTLNKDLTFSYIDRSVSSNPIVVTGTYTIDKGKVKLTSKDSEKSFHSVWKIKEDGNVAKARKGLCFYRLVKL